MISARLSVAVRRVAKKWNGIVENILVTSFKSNSRAENIGLDEIKSSRALFLSASTLPLPLPRHLLFSGLLNRANGSRVWLVTSSHLIPRKLVLIRGGKDRLHFNKKLKLRHHY